MQIQLQRISPSAGDQVQLNIWIEFYISFKKLLNTLHACTLSNRVFVIRCHTNLTVIEKCIRAHPRQLLASKVVAKHKIHSLVKLVGTPSPTLL